MYPKYNNTKKTRDIGVTTKPKTSVIHYKGKNEI